MKYNLKYFTFTKNESKVILFMMIVLLSGFTIKYVKSVTSDNKNKIYDYSKSDELFKKLSGNNSAILSADSLIQKDSTVKEDISLTEKKLKAAEDSLKTNGKKKSKKEEKLKPKSININTATKEILEMLPGVGESTAEKIIKYREEHNGFKKIENIMKVKGIGKKKFEKLKDYITVE